MEKALVASDVGGHKELITDKKTGLLFAAGNADDLAQKIDMILADKTLEKSLQQQGSQWVRQHHTWEATTKEFTSHNLTRIKDIRKWLLKKIHS